MDYIVTSANWKVEVHIDDEEEKQHPDVEYSFMEAATRALEEMYSAGFVETSDGEKAKVGANIQVCKKEFYFNVKELEYVEIQKRIENQEVKFIFSPVALANAGRHEIASYLMHIIEENT